MQLAGEKPRIADDLGDNLGLERTRRRDGRGVSRMAPRRLDVLQDRADHGGVAVRHAVHVEFNGVFEEFVDQDGLAFRRGDGFGHVFVELGLARDDRHAPSAQDETRAHQNRVADFARDPPGVRNGMGDAARRLLHADVRNEFLEEIAVFRAVDVVRRGADDRRTGFLEALGQVQRRLPAVLHDDAVALFAVIDLHHVLESERLEVEPVRGVVVGRDGFRIRVDHHDFVSAALESERRVAAAPVELDALADAVGAAPEDHDLFLAVRHGVRGIRGFPAV